MDTLANINTILEFLHDPGFCPGCFEWWSKSDLFEHFKAKWWKKNTILNTKWW